jgi:hypothetical protein
MLALELSLLSSSWPFSFGHYVGFLSVYRPVNDPIIIVAIPPVKRK